MPLFNSCTSIVPTLILCLLCAFLPCFCLADQPQEFVIRDIDLTAIVLDNNRVIPAKVVDDLTAPYLNRRITYLDLELLRNNLTLWLVQNGYITSGVVIPDQEVSGGVVHLAVVEGKLTSVEITGTSSFAKSYFESRIARASAPPLNVNKLQETLQLLNQDQRITALNAELAAGLVPGESTVKLRVSEASPWQLALAANNDNPPSIGAYHGGLIVGHRNLTGRGDSLEGLFGGSEGGYDVGMHYSYPLTAAETMGELYFHISDARVTEAQFQPLDIRSNANTYGARISHPLLRTLRREIRPSLAYEYRESKNFLLGEGFSFSPRENDGQSRLSVARLGLEWIERTDASVLVATSTVNIGVTGGGFLSWLGRLLGQHRLGFLNSQLHGRGEIQLADRVLSPMEQYALGGLYSVRGFKKDLMLRDNAINASLEWWLPLLHDYAGNDMLSLVTFADYGRGWSNGADTGNGGQSRDLASTGAGLKFLWKGLAIDLFYGYPLLDSGGQKWNDLQDHGFQFMAVWNIL